MPGALSTGAALPGPAAADVGEAVAGEAADGEAADGEGAGDGEAAGDGGGPATLEVPGGDAGAVDGGVDGVAFGAPADGEGVPPAVPGVVVGAGAVTAGAGEEEDGAGLCCCTTCSAVAVAVGTGAGTAGIPAAAAAWAEAGALVGPPFSGCGADAAAPGAVTRRARGGAGTAGITTPTGPRSDGAADSEGAGAGAGSAFFLSGSSALPGTRTGIQGALEFPEASVAAMTAA
ncbi:hypothetical protein ACL02U_03140 [Streptomyces sp. MS06]|uniref:hypothetical protein n=1 Tax=Streptomyces sp. MS06 TaxID=3385974 RepID=UPI0039A0E0D0